MRKFITTSLVVVASVLGIIGSSSLVATPSVAALTANQEAVCKSIGAGKDCDKNDSGGTDINRVIKTVIKIMSGLVGVLAVIMIIISGFKYVTAAGDSAKITSAKHTLVYAIVGLIIVALAQVIVKFVLNKAT